MKYAPILIPTLCRDKHFIRLVESLKRNTWAKYTDIYIGLDFPPSEKYEEGYKRICQYLEGDFFEFASFNVIKHSENVGSLANMESLREIVFKKYDRFIRTDDDTEFSPNFIEYVDKCLMKYENDPDIIAVTGYSYPIDWQVSKGANILKENFICPMWGTGFWRDRYWKIKKEIEEGCLPRSIPFVIKNKLTKNMLTTCRYEYINLCLSSTYKETLAARMTDIAIRMYMAIFNKFVIVPTVSKVRNWGFDGSGEYCSKSQRSSGKINARTFFYENQKIDENTDFCLIPDINQKVDVNRFLLDKFEDLSIKGYLSSKFKILILNTLGLDKGKMFLKRTKLIR